MPPGTALASVAATFTATRGRADAALGADERVDLALLGCRPRGLNPADGGTQLVLEDGVRQALTDAGTHRFEDPCPVQRGQDHQHARERVLAPDGAQGFGQRPAAPVIDDQQLRCPGAGSGQLGQRRRAGGRHAHPLRPEHLGQRSVAGDQHHIHGPVSLPHQADID